MRPNIRFGTLRVSKALEFQIVDGLTMIMMET